MKKFKLLGIALFMGVAALFQSCDDNDGYSIGDIAVDYVTAHVTQNGEITFTGDSWGTMWPAASSVVGFRPTEGQRAFMLFNPLADNFQGYDVAIKVERVNPILTKGVEQLTSESEKEYGDDPVRITNAWIGGGYMNIIFNQIYPKNTKHRVSLVENTEKEYADDGYVHLEYRYNTYGDTLSQVMVRSMVSYNLDSLDFKGKQGVKMRINSAKNGNRVLTFDFKDQKAPEKGLTEQIDNSHVR